MRQEAINGINVVCRIIICMHNCRLFLIALHHGARSNIISSDHDWETVSRDLCANGLVDAHDLQRGQDPRKWL